MNIKRLTDKIAPMTRKQYEDRCSYAKKEAYRYICAAECNSNRILNVHDRSLQWNGCRQSFEITDYKNRIIGYYSKTEAMKYLEEIIYTDENTDKISLF